MYTRSDDLVLSGEGRLRSPAAQGCGPWFRTVVAGWLVSEQLKSRSWVISGWKSRGIWDEWSWQEPPHLLSNTLIGAVDKNEPQQLDTWVVIGLIFFGVTVALYAPFVWEGLHGSA
jgi:hypothetical protein